VTIRRYVAWLLAAVACALVLALAAPQLAFAATPEEVPPPAEPAPVEVSDAQTGSLVPDPGVSEYPIFNYDLGYDEGAWNHLGRKTIGFFTTLGWTINLIIVAVVLWFVGWAFQFKITTHIEGPLLEVAMLWDERLVVGLALGDVVWFILILYVAVHAMRGRGLHAASEMLLSVLALGAMVAISANPAGYIAGAGDTLRQTSAAAVAVSRGEEPTSETGESVAFVDDLRGGLFEVLVEQPHEIVNWGHPLSGSCREAAQAAIADGPHGAADDPRNMMKDAGCESEADFNHAPSASRLASAWLAAVVSLAVLALLLVCAVTMAAASLFFMFRFAWLFVALLGFQLPGPMREFAWGWLVGLLKHLLVVAGTSMVLAYLMLLFNAFLHLDGVGLAERFAMMLTSAVAMFMYRKQVIAGVHHFAERLRAELGGLRLGMPYGMGGRGGWTGSNAGVGGGLTGYGVSQRAREVVRDLPGTRAYRASDAGRQAPFPSPGRYVRRRFGSQARAR
jgi:hypothetical protein